MATTEMKEMCYSFYNIVVHYLIKKRIWFRSSTAQTEPVPILKNVSGTIKSNQFLAILGASGVGKSTLLNVLAARHIPECVVSGDIRLNGNLISNDDLVHMSAYAQQKCMFVSHVTVREHLTFVAALGMNQEITYRRKIKRVEEVLNELGLSHCKDSRIGLPGISGSISGGERKRLAIASQVLTEPTLIICDEPTSGLDSFAAKSVVTMLKDMAKRGKIVIATFHQPSSEIFQMFDRIMLLAEGRVAFFGSVEDVSTFFKSGGFICPRNYNPADFYIKILATAQGDEAHMISNAKVLCDEFENSLEGKQLMALSTHTTDAIKNLENGSLDRMKVNHHRKASILTQFRALYWRSTIAILRNATLLKAVAFKIIVTSLLIGIMFFGQKLSANDVTNINGCLFHLSSTLSLTVAIKSIPMISLEIPMFTREHGNGLYGTRVFYYTILVTQVQLFLCEAIGLITITYWMIGLNPDPIRFINVYAIIILAIITAHSFGFLISVCFPNATLALNIVLTIIPVYLVFGGFLLNIRSLSPWISWVQYCSWMRYTFEAIVINQWSGITNIDCNGSARCFINGTEVIESLGFEEGQFSWNILFILLQICLYHIAANITLSVTAKARS